MRAGESACAAGAGRGTEWGQGRGGAAAKHRDRATPQGEQYLWAGDQLIEAAPIYADGTVAWSQATRWAYAPGGITPLAQHKAGKLWYVVADHLGTPRELLSEAGEVEWSNSPETWGQHRLWSRRAANDDAVDCPHRFPGQYFDAESGLHYNRHRYYDPGTAQYLSPDPLKLGGGFRPQGYVHDPNGWVDPLGLVGCPDPKQERNKKTSYEAASRRDAFRQAKRDAKIPMQQRPFEISRPQLEDGYGSPVIGADGAPVTTRQYHFRNIDGEEVLIQEHSYGHDKATPKRGAEPHFNVRPPDNPRTGSVPGTHGHYNFPGSQ